MPSNGPRKSSPNASSADPMRCPEWAGRAWNDGVSNALFRLSIVARPTVIRGKLLFNLRLHKWRTALRLVSYDAARHIAQQAMKRTEGAEDLLRKRRRLDEVGARTVAQIFAKPPLVDLHRQTAIRCCNQFALELARCCVAHPAKIGASRILSAF